MNEQLKGCKRAKESYERRVRENVKKKTLSPPIHKMEVAKGPDITIMGNCSPRRWSEKVIRNWVKDLLAGVNAGGDLSTWLDSVVQRGNFLMDIGRNGEWDSYYQTTWERYKMDLDKVEVDMEMLVREACRRDPGQKEGGIAQFCLRSRRRVTIMTCMESEYEVLMKCGGIKTYLREVEQVLCVWQNIVL